MDLLYLRLNFSLIFIIIYTSAFGAIILSIFNVLLTE